MSPDPVKFCTPRSADEVTGRDTHLDQQGEELLVLPPRLNPAATKSLVAASMTSRPRGVLIASIPRPSAGLGLRSTKA